MVVERLYPVNLKKQVYVVYFRGLRDSLRGEVYAEKYFYPGDLNNEERYRFRFMPPIAPIHLKSVSGRLLQCRVCRCAGLCGYVYGDEYK